MRGKQDFMMNRPQFHLKMCFLSIIKDHSKHRTQRRDGCFDCGLLETQGRSCEL